MPFDGNTNNNIVMSTATHGIHGVGVMKDPEDPDPDRRYKAFFRHAKPRRMATGYSRDGLIWSDPEDWPEHDAVGDTHNNAIRLAGKQSFVGITRGWIGENPNRYRTVLRTTSTDFVSWTDPQLVLAGNSMEDQIYSIPIKRCKNVYIGLPAIYHGGDRNAENWDLVDTELAWSIDTVTWNRISPGTPLIPRGNGSYPTGDYDCGCIYAATPLEMNDTIYLYYGGSNGLHTDFRETFFCLATLPRDRFAGYSPVDSVSKGVLMTKAFRIIGEKITVNTDAESDNISVALVSDDGTTIEGFGHGVCKLEDNGPVEKQISWENSISSLAGQSVSFQIVLKNSSVFALGGQIAIS